MPLVRNRATKSFFLLWMMTILAVGVSVTGGAPPGNTSDTLALDLALARAGVERGRLSPDPLRLIASSGEARESVFLQSLRADPLNVSYRVGMMQDRFLANTNSPLRLFIYTVNLGDVDIARGYLGNPLRRIDQRLLKAQDPLDEALRMTAESGGKFFWAGTLPSWTELPNPLRFEIARVVATAAQGEKFRQRAFARLPAGLKLDEVFHQVLAGSAGLDESADFRKYIAEVEREALAAGMLDLLAALEDFDDFLDHSTQDFPALNWELETSLGHIVLRTGREDSVTEVERPFVVIDLGGNDRYFSVETSNPTSGISVIYDREGNDEHFSEPGRGSGAMLGLGVCWDAGNGNDRHESQFLGVSGALLAATVVVDEGGDDVYISNGCSQAYAVGGFAMLLDLGGGNDTFTSTIRSQASAGPLAAAVLVDVEGDSVYTLRDAPVIDPSPQNASVNTSLGQGAATGLRADLLDGRSLPGGVALLLDGAGNDFYTGGVFVQGAGFLSGAGVLVDRSGNDRYTGAWYAQAAGAHRAAGVLLDLDGDDVYTATQYTSIAAGHDFSVGFLLDAAGNDRYSVGNLGLGAGNDNGVGILADLGGNDSYTITQKDSFGLGDARITLWGTSREMSLTLGLFLDLGGTDRYDVSRGGPVNDGLWSAPRQYPEMSLPSESSAGLDGDYPSPFFTGPRTRSTGEDQKSLRAAWEERRAYRASIPGNPAGSGKGD